MRYYLSMKNVTASEWLAQISKNREGADGAFVAGLSGHLGAGKTAFVKLVAKELRIEEIVTSPTFVIMKIYETKKDGGVFKRLVHIDAYRLERRAELEGLGIEKIFADKHSLVMIEWPENVRLNATGLDSWLKFEIRDGTYMISDTISP